MIPKKYLDNFVHEYPHLTILVLVWGLGLWVFVGYILVRDWGKLGP